MVEEIVTVTRRALHARRTAWRVLGPALGSLLVLHAPVDATAAEDAGVAVVVAGAGSSRSVDGGGSRTEFSLRLPDGVACPGDSETDGYRVQSFMVPATVMPGDVQYDGLGPAPNAYGQWEVFRQPLYDTFTRPYVSALTAVAAKAGGPGAIVNIPTFTFSVYGRGELPPGSYRIGIACTLSNQPVRYWATEMKVTSAPEDSPAGITWSVTNAEDEGTGNLTTRAVVGVGVATIALVAVTAARRRRADDLTNSTEGR